MEPTKQCSKCNELKSVGDFYKRIESRDGLRNECIQCIKQNVKKNYLINKTEINEYNRKYYQANKDEILENNRKYYENNKNQILEHKKLYYQNNKSEILESKKQYDQKHKTEIADYNKQYKQTHKTELAEYQRLRRQNDIQFRLITNIRTRLNKCIKNKAQTTKDLIGIDFDTFINWINYQMPAGYSMEDLGVKLHIDHVIPISSFDLTDESQLQKAMSWVNLQPLEATKNLSKSNSINPWLLVCQEIKAKYFINNQ